MHKKIIDLIISLIYSLIDINNWKSPPKKKIIIYDTTGVDVLKKYFHEHDYTILKVRFENNDKINFYIIIKLLFNLEFNIIKKYKFEYIKCVSPLFIISMSDYNYAFYRLKKIFWMIGWLCHSDKKAARPIFFMRWAIC